MCFFSLVYDKDGAMIRQVCNVKSEDVATTRLVMLLAQLAIDYLEVILREKRIRWFGHLERSSGAIRTAYDIQIDGNRGTERPKMPRKTEKERDRREWNLNEVDPCDKDVWRSSVRSAMRAASQLPERESTVVDDAFASAPMQYIVFLIGVLLCLCFVALDRKYSVKQHYSIGFGTESSFFYHRMDCGCLSF